MDYFTVGPGIEPGQVASYQTTRKIYNEYNNAFTGIWCFKDTFSLQVIDGMMQYQALPRHVAYVLKEPFKNKSWKDYTNTKGLAPLEVDKVAKWCNSFVIAQYTCA